MRELFAYDLDRRPGVIARLKAEADFEGFVDPEINDERFPTPGTGLTPVRFRIVSSDELRRPNGRVERADVEACFRERGMRFCDAAEALLPVAKDRELGRGARTYVAIIQGTHCTFYVNGHGHGHDAWRYLYLYSNHVYVHWFDYGEFVGVCE